MDANQREYDKRENRCSGV